MNNFNMVEKVMEINSLLQRKSLELNFNFMKQDSSWFNKNGSLNHNLHSDDNIHLSNRGNMKLANTIIGKLKSLCLSPSDPIMKISLINEVAEHDNGSNVVCVPSESLSSVLPVHVTCIKRTVFVPTSFVPAPKCDYDHN